MPRRLLPPSLALWTPIWLLSGALACQAKAPAKAPESPAKPANATAPKTSPAEATAPRSYPIPELPRGGAIVARVGPVRIHAEAISARFDAMPMIERAQLASPGRMADFLEDQLALEIAAQEAFKRGLFTRAEEAEKAAKQLIEADLNAKYQAWAATEADRIAAFEREDEAQGPSLDLAQRVWLTPTPKAKARADRELRRLESQLSRLPSPKRELHFDAAIRAKRQLPGPLESARLSVAELEARYGEAETQALLGLQTGQFRRVALPGALALVQVRGKQIGGTLRFQAIEARLKSELDAVSKNRFYRRYLAELAREHRVFIDREALDRLSQTLTASLTH